MHKPHWITTAQVSALAVCLITTASTHAALTITDVGRFDFTDTSGSGARELSGIAYAGGSSYLSVGDKDKILHTLSISLDMTSGQITSATIDPTPVVLSSSFNGDREAIVLQGSHVLTTNEAGPQLEAFDAMTGLSTGTPVNISTPGLGIYGSDRPNRSWESLALFQSNTSTVLFANEDALIPDGPAASFTQGAVVRIQAASADAANSTAAAIGQFAYPTDAINGDNPFVTSETSGLVELLTLPGNEVIAMERSVGLSGYRIRLYQINGESATDVSGLTGLAGLTPGVDYTPLSKTLLWDKTFSALSNSNFEGIALGPTLSTGETSLILVADNASGPVLPIFGQQWTEDDQSLYALTVVPEPDPGSACLGNSGCLTADLNHDGYVGIADLNILLVQWNQTVFPGTGPDSNVDGFVGVEDLNIVLGNWNAGTPPNTESNIPEPTTAAISSAVILSFLCRHRRFGAA